MTSISSLTIGETPEAIRPLERKIGLVSSMTAMVGPGTRKGMLSLVDQAVISATSFITTIIVARASSREELGVYYLILTLVFLARGIQMQVIFAPYIVYCHRRTGDASATYAGSVLMHQCGMLLIVTVGLLGVAGIMGLGTASAALSRVVWVLIGALPFLLLREFNRNFSLAHLQLGEVMVVDAAVSILQLGCLGLLWHFRAISVPAVFGVIGGVCAAACLGWFLSQKHPWRFERAQIAADWRGNWSFARWALAGHVVGSTTPHVMPWILTAVHGEASVALLGACGTLVGLPNVFVMGLSNLLGPKAARAFTEQGKAGLCRVLQKATVAFTLCAGGFCLLSLVAGDRLVMFVYGNRYGGGGPVLTVLALSVFAISMGIVAGSGLWAMDRPRTTFITDLCGLVVTFAAGAFCIPPFGALGAAIAITTGIGVSAAMKWTVFLRLIRSIQENQVSTER